MKKVALAAGALILAVGPVFGASVTVDQMSGEVRGATSPMMFNSYIEQDVGNAFSGEVYSHFRMSGSVTDAYLLTTAGWGGGWLNIGLIGMDYFTGDAQNPWTYFGNTAYGDMGRQIGFGANAVLVVYDQWQGNTVEFNGVGFTAEDCYPHTDEHYVYIQSPTSALNSFAFELEYDLKAGTMTARVKDLGDAEWDSETTIKVGFRNVYPNSVDLYDDWSVLAPAIQMGITELPSTRQCRATYENVVTEVLDVLPGDANMDGMVDVGDLGILAGNYGSAGNWFKGDFNGDGAVDVGDLGILAGNYGSSIAGSAESVPEPIPLALLALGSGLALRRRR